MLLASMGVSIVRVGYAPGGQALARTLEAQGAAAINRRVTTFSAVEFDEPVRRRAWISSAPAAFNWANGAPSGSVVACGTITNCAGG
jgi:secreted PhoX family phosphatase